MQASRSVFRKLLLTALVSGLLAAVLPLGAADGDQALLDKAKSLFQPLPASSALADSTPQRVALGKALFFETRVSNDGRLGCATCHNPAFYGADALALSVGVNGKVLPRNASTVFNTSLLISQHFGGNRATVEEQAVKALLSPLAYGNTSYEQVEKKLQVLGYQSWFEKAFAGEAKPLSADNWGKAIGAYEPLLQIGSVRGFRNGCGLRCVQHMQKMTPPHSGWNVFEASSLVRAEDDCTNSSASLHEQLGHDGHKRQHEFTLALSCACKIHGASQV
jgi:hypothetical protein